MAKFLGSYFHAMDHKGRVSIPARFRKHLRHDTEDALILTLGLDGCLYGFSDEGWQQVEERLSALSFTQQNNRLFVRQMASHAVGLSLDAQGRIPVPKSLLEKAVITTDALFVGAINHFEIWNPSTYKMYLEASGKTFEEIAETVLL